MARALIRFIPIVIVFGLWEATTRYGLVSKALVPDLANVGAAFWQLLASGELLSNAGHSLARAFIGLAAATAFGVVAGLLMATMRPVRLLVNPLVQVFYPMPKSALIPVVMVWFGLGDMSKVVLIFLGCILPVVVSTYNGARGVDHVLVWSAASLGASRRAILTEIVLPAAMPEILNGIRTALAFSFILMVSSEFIMAKDGIGYLIATLGDGGAYAAMFACIFTVAGVGFGADRMFGLLIRRTLRWREQ